MGSEGRTSSAHCAPLRRRRGKDGSVYGWRSRLAMVTGWQVGGSFGRYQAGGLRMWMSSEAERQRFTVEYYDFNAPVRVTRPAGC